MTDPDRLAIEYRQWKLTQELRDLFQRKFSVRKQEWLRNTFDRWLLSVHEEESGIYSKDDQFPLYPLGLKADDAVHEVIVNEIAKELQSKSIFESRKHMMEYLEFIEKRKSCLLKEENPVPPLKILPGNCTLQSDKVVTLAGMQIGELQTKTSRRIAFLAEQFGQEVTAIMLLRYESLGTGSYQWGDPVEIHQQYYKFGARYEGFASPLNSRFLGQPGAKFCSLFPDTDAVFGSLGNFLKIDFDKYPGGWSVNPPFIESLLDDVAIKILAALDAASGEPGCLYFFCCMPYWDDTPGWIKLQKSKHLVKHVNFGKCKYVVQDAYQNPLDPNCGLSHFVLGYLPKNMENKIDMLEKIMYSVYRKWENIVHGDSDHRPNKRHISYSDMNGVPLFRKSRYGEDK